MIDYRDNLTVAMHNHRQREIDGGVLADRGKASYELAAAMGVCNLFAVHGDEDRHHLSPEQADAAFIWAKQYLPTCGENFRRDAAEKTAAGPIVALTVRMDAWGVKRALRDCCNWYASSDIDNKLRKIYHCAECLIDMFDRVLQSDLAYLSNGIHHPLRDEWCAQRTNRHMYLPWWLDDTLDDVRLLVRLQQRIANDRILLTTVRNESAQHLLDRLQEIVHSTECK